MSAYLVIGLATRIMAQKRFFRSRFDNKSELKDEMERLFNATDIYSIYEDVDNLIITMFLNRYKICRYEVSYGL